MKKFKIWWYKLVLPKNIKERIWDAILEGQNQFEQWEDIDTCNLIIKSITGEAVFNNIPKDFFKQHVLSSLATSCSAGCRNVRPGKGRSSAARACPGMYPAGTVYAGH